MAMARPNMSMVAKRLEKLCREDKIVEKEAHACGARKGEERRRVLGVRGRGDEDRRSVGQDR